MALVAAVDGTFTVSFAAALVVLAPAAFVTTHVYEPASVAAILAIVNVFVVADALVRLVVPSFHWYNSVPGPVALTEKLTGKPRHVVDFWVALKL